MRRLVIRPGAIGDLIVSLPALECLRMESDEFEVWTTGRNVPLIRFAQARSIASTGLDLLGIAEPPSSLMERLRGFDSIVSWFGANRAEFRQAVDDLPFEFFPALPPDGCPMHATDFYLNQIQQLVGHPVAESRRTPRISCEAAPG